MDNDLERSVRLLEDALSTPTKGLFKTTGTGNRLSNVSITLTEGELERLLLNESNLNYSDTMAILVDHDKTVTGSVVQTATPWESTMNNMYTEFASILQNNSGGSDVLQVAEDLARCCSDALTVIQTLKSKVNISELPEETVLENERNNWRLIFALYQDRLTAQNSSTDEFDQYSGHSERYCIDCLFKRDSLIRESQLVIDWLERNASDGDDPILHQSDWTYGWENTLHQLMAPDSIAIGSNTKIVKSIHPDVVLSEGLPLHHLDMVSERQLNRRIFAEIRCGKLEEAQELCCSCGHPWKAALLEGWKLYHNPNLKEDGENNRSADDKTMSLDNYEYKDIEGNMNRDLWKANAVEFCKIPELDIHERASIGSLCGFLEPVLSVCNTWDDYLWAYMKTMVDIRVESEIRDSIIKNYKPLPEEYWEQKMSLNEIFTNLEASKSAQVRAESLYNDHIIQKHIILDEIPSLIDMIKLWIDNAKVSTHSLRFYAHLVLLFDHLGETKNRESYENIVEAYISRLSEMNETQLVGFYVSKLGKRKQIEIYAKHLESIEENSQRRDSLVFAEDYRIDVYALTKKVVENIRNRPSDLDVSGNLNQKISSLDEMKISALDWLLFYEEQRAEALLQANAMIFTFLTLGNIDAAQLLLGKIPSDSVTKIMQEGNTSQEVKQIIKDYLSYKAYLDAQEAFNNWFKQFNNKPQPPGNLPENAQFTEKVAHEHKVAQYQGELERWKLTSSHSAKTAKTLLYNVLLFPQGWLVGGQDADYLRALCIPEVSLLLYSVLSNSENHEEAVQLADLIAAEKNKLYTVYSKEKLAELLEKICESSMVLVKTKKDPFGNSSA